MKTFLDCIPCFMDQALRGGRIASNDEKIIKKILNEVGRIIPEIPLENTPPETGALIYKIINEVSGNYDPYKDIKITNIKQVQLLYPELEEEIDKSNDRLLTAIRLAVAGNVIDLGIDKKFNIAEDVKKILQQDFAVFDYELFKTELKKAENILYIGDNSGEAVFDKLLIKELNKPVTFVVRGKPVINDITIKEAEIIGIDKITRIISSGVTSPGTILNLCNEDFIKEFNSADMIISKGQGNYEGLSDVKRPVFFLLKAKCPVISRDIGVAENDIVLKGINL